MTPRQAELIEYGFVAKSKPLRKRGLQFRYTAQLKSKTTTEYREKLQKKFLEALSKFPELDPSVIVFGLATQHEADARGVYDFIKKSKEEIRIGINPGRTMVSYKTLGHELTHFLQWLGKVPQGEKSCDIYTLARNKLFFDQSPNYLEIPLGVEIEWHKYASAVRQTCIMAIEKRNNGERKYIQWCEENIARGGGM